MNLFQLLTLPVVVGLLLWELLDRRRRRVSTAFWLTRCVVWVAAGIAIYRPGLVQDVATAIGIGRKWTNVDLLCERLIGRVHNPPSVWRKSGLPDVGFALEIGKGFAIPVHREHPESCGGRRTVH